MAATELDLNIEGFQERILFVRACRLRLPGTKMAALLGVPHTTLKTWEAEKDPATPHDILDVADRYERVCADRGLHITAEWILRGGAQLSTYLTGVEMPQGQMELPYVDHASRVLDVA